MLTSPMSPGKIMCIKEELTVSPSLEFMPFSSLAMGELDLDEFELHTFDQVSPPFIFLEPSNK
jgi:hypothetical protein